MVAVYIYPDMSRIRHKIVKCNINKNYLLVLIIIKSLVNITQYKMSYKNIIIITCT